jgi:hypothetical protein
MFSGSAKAQNATLPAWREDHEEEAAKWLEQYINPTNEANYDSLRLIGYDQLMHMNNRPAMMSTLSSSWMPCATSEQGLVSGRGSCIAFSPTGTIYYGVTKGGLWKSTDSGTTWISLSGTWKTLDLAGVAVDPKNQNIVYASTGTSWGGVGGGGDETGIGIYKSVDGGLNWTLLSNSPRCVTTQMEVNPSGSNLVYCAYSGGVSLSNDSGATWKSVLSLGGYTTIVFDPNNPAIVYAAGGGDIEKSLDSGHTWASLPSGYPTGTWMVLGISRSSDSIYLSSGDGNSDANTVEETGSTLALSTDAGQSWTSKSSNINYLGQQGAYANAMAVSPTNPSVVLAGGLDIYASSTGGSNMRQKTVWYDAIGASDYSHADIHVLKYNPFDGRLYALTDGGIYYTKDNGETWSQDMNNTLNTLSFIGGDMAVNSSGGPDFFCAGAQDNGLNAITFGTDPSNYTQIQGGDGGTMFVSPFDGQTVFGTYTNTVLYRSESRGADNTWDAPSDPADPRPEFGQNILGSAIIKEGAPFYMTYDVWDGDPSVVACCGVSNLYLETGGNIGQDAFPRATNVIDPTTNKIIPSSAVSGSVVAVNIATSDDDYIYIGTRVGASTGYFYYSTDVGKTWTQSLTSTGAALKFTGIPSGITTDPNDATRVFMTITGPGTKHFYFSTDNGQTWNAPATNLPALNYHCVAIDASGILYISNDYSVLRSGDTGKTWYPVADGMPLVLITSLQVRGKYLDAATYGRGMYYIDVTQLAPLGPSSVATSASSTLGIAITAVYPSVVTTSAPRSNVDYTLSGNEQATLAVYDVLGRQERMLLNQFDSQGGHELAADLSGLPTGQHYLVLTAGGNSVTKPIVIQ